MKTPELPDRAPLHAATPVKPAASRKPAKKTIVVAAASLVTGVILGVAGSAIASSVATNVQAEAEAAKPGLLKSATTSCAVSNNPGAKLGDNDTSLSLNGRGSEDSSGLSGMEFSCVLDAIKVPDYVRAQMQQTRALDGTQHESWGSISATWTYHPDDGLDIGLKEK